MFTRSSSVIVGAVVLAVAVTAEPSPQTAAVFEHYQRNVEAYMALRDEAAETVAPLSISPDAKESLEWVGAIAQAICARRPDAHVGDVVSIDVQPAFRTLIAASLLANQDTVAELMARNNAEVIPGSPRPAINKPFPWQRGAAMPPYLLAALPRLPHELQYRIVDRDLLLVDIDANVVIDILENALVNPEE